MPKEVEGSHDATNKIVAIVAGRFNDFVTTKLASSAVDCFVEHGVEASTLETFWVPGAFEVPQMALRIANDQKVDGILCVGAIIRGETNHFDILSASVIKSVADIPAKFLLPVAYGIVSADSLEQAMDRAGGKHGNKGWESALALIEMMALWEKGRG